MSGEKVNEEAGAVRKYTDESQMIDGEGAKERPEVISEFQLFWLELLKALGRLDFRKKTAKINKLNPAEISEIPEVSPEERERRKQEILEALQEKLKKIPELAGIFLGNDLSLDIQMRLESLSDPITFEDARALINTVVTYSDEKYISAKRTIIGFDVNEPERGYVFSFAQTERLESELLHQEAAELNERISANLEYQNFIPGTQNVEYVFSGFTSPFVLRAFQKIFSNEIWIITNMRVDDSGSYISLGLKEDGFKKIEGRYDI